MIKVGDILKTRDGCQVEITEAGPDRLRGIVSLRKNTTWALDGKWAHYGNHNMDLMTDNFIGRIENQESDFDIYDPLPGRKSRWLNWYGDDLLLILFDAVIAWLVFLTLCIVLMIAIEYPSGTALFFLTCVAVYFTKKHRNDRAGRG